MSQTIISDNTTIKISAGVSASTSTSGTVYTAPANSYAIVQIHLGTSAQITVGGKIVVDSAAVGTYGPYYVGPSQILAWSIQGGAGSINVSGVVFINSP